MSPVLNLYSSDRPAVLAFAQLLAENLTQPVQVRSLTELPSPDTQRPTRQQLRQERAAILPALEGVQANLRQAEGNPVALGHMLPDLRALRDRYTVRLEQIKQVLGEQRGGQTDA